MEISIFFTAYILTSYLKKAIRKWAFFRAKHAHSSNYEGAKSKPPDEI